MILGIGVDIFASKRINKLLGKPKMLQDFFHPFEIAYSNLLSDKMSYLASCFAAKEAFLKALGFGVGNFNLSDICLLREKCINEKLLLYGSVLQFLERDLDKYLVHVSTSVDENYAIAVVIVERL